MNFELRGLSREIVLILLSCIIGAIVTYIIFRPAPIAGLYCIPLSGYAPLKVSCFNESQHYKTALWDFGDGTNHVPDTKREETHIYKSAGTYTITLKVAGTESVQDSRTVEVLESPYISSGPITLNIRGMTKDEVIIENRAVRISQKKSDHPSFSRHSRGYTIPFDAREGYTIINARLKEESSARAEHINWSISDDGRKLTLKFKLTSGPKYDRWDGWLYGTLTIEEQRVEAGTEIAIATNLRVDRPRLYHLDASPILNSLASWDVELDGTSNFAVTPPTNILILQEPPLMLSLHQDEYKGGLFLRVESSNTVIQK